MILLTAIIVSFNRTCNMLFHRISGTLGIMRQDKSINLLMFFIDMSQLLLIDHTGTADTFHKVVDRLHQTVDYLVSGTLCNAEMELQIVLQEVLIVLVHISSVRLM